MNQFRIRNFKVFLVGLGVMASLIGPSPAPACTAIASHPYHVSSAQINWNADSGNFEVALCVWPADLEKALSQFHKSTIDLDEVENLDELILPYVAQRFTIEEVSTDEEVESKISADSNEDEGEAKIRWVGQEMDLKKAWLYFEVVGDTGQQSWKIKNRIFFELNEDQINQVQISIAEKIESIPLNADKTSFEFETNSPSDIQSVPRVLRTK